ncbi:MAG: ABC transporter permease [Mesorhizobium sp.]|nr:ABC transporter permease [Mesorhizobium sp.]
MLDRQTAVILPLIRREIAGRYRGSWLGLLWSLITPLFMLGVYTFVFGFVLKTRWTAANDGGAAHSTTEFAVVLFAGLLVFQFFAEVVARAPLLVLSNKNYVKKIVFPIEVLPVVAIGAALFHVGVSLVVLLVFVFGVFGSIPWTFILAPLVIAPLVLLILGLSWFLAAIGVYFRDISQFIAPIITAMMFMSPIFFPRTTMPDWLQPLMFLNPLTLPVEAMREVVVFGQQPNWTALGLYSLVALAAAVLGYQFFQITRRGFADVL